MLLWCQVYLQKCELTNFHIRNFRVVYTTMFGMSSNVIGNSQYCCCSSICTVLVLQKGPVCSDLSKQHCLTKTIQITCSLYLSGTSPKERSSVLRDPIHIQVALMSAIISVLPFEMQQWQKCRLLREFSRPDDMHNGNRCAPNRGASWSSVSDNSVNDKGAGVQNWHLFLFLINKILCM